MRNPIKRIKAWIASRISRAVRRELNVIFRREGEVCIDHHFHDTSWAIIKVDVDDVCYLKFLDLGKADLREIQQFMRRFDRARIDARPDIMRMANGTRLHHRYFDL